MENKLLTTKEMYVLVFLGATILIGSMTAVFVRWDNGSPSPVQLVGASTQLDRVAEPQVIVVSILGEVHNPGVYELDPANRVNDLVNIAGGMTPKADHGNINLAAPLIDGTTLIIPQQYTQGESRPNTPNPPQYTLQAWRNADPTSAWNPASGRLDLNRATQTDLEALPGIGPALARIILEHREQRPFEKVDELLEVPGIGPDRLEAIRDLISVAP